MAEISRMQSGKYEDDRLKRFIDSIERWRIEADAGEAPRFIDTLISTPIRELTSIGRPAYVNQDSSVQETIEAFRSSRTVVIKVANKLGLDSELLFGRLSFLEHALEMSNLHGPVSSLIEKGVPVIGCVQFDDTLDIALQHMITDNCQEVGVMNAGRITGTISLDDIYSFILHDLVVFDASAKPSSPQEKDFLGSKIFENMREVRSNRFESDGNMETDGAEWDISPMRLSALEWCKSGWTECLIMLCLTLDMSCAIVDWSSLSSDFSITKIIIATGVILFVFTFERLVRTYGYGSILIFRPLERPIEILDNSIILVSVVVYSMIIFSDLEQISKTVLTVSRIVRLLRLVKVVQHRLARPCVATRSGT